MKSRDTVIRLRKFQVDERRRKLVEDALREAAEDSGCAGFSTSMGFEMLFLGLRRPSLTDNWSAPSRARCGSTIGMHRTFRRTARVFERRFSALRRGQRQQRHDLMR